MRDAARIAVQSEYVRGSGEEPDLIDPVGDQERRWPRVDGFDEVRTRFHLGRGPWAFGRVGLVVDEVGAHTGAAGNGRDVLPDPIVVLTERAGHVGVAAKPDKPPETAARKLAEVVERVTVDEVEAEDGLAVEPGGREVAVVDSSHRIPTSCVQRRGGLLGMGARPAAGGRKHRDGERHCEEEMSHLEPHHHRRRPAAWKRWTARRSGHE